MTSSIEVESLSKRYKLRSDRNQRLSMIFKNSFYRDRKKNDFFWVIDNLTFHVNPGEGLGVIGSNGSGKSTLLKLLTGIIKPTKGFIRVTGKVSSLIELGAGFHPDFTGRENVLVNGLMLGMDKKEIKNKFNSIIDFAELWEFIDVPVKYYSSGMQARLGFAIATAVEPDLLIVDEVLAVGDVGFQEKCRDHIRHIKNLGSSIILVSHSASDILELCENAIWLDRGKPIMQGQSARVVAGYLAAHERRTKSEG